jgi:hypothetical protein
MLRYMFTGHVKLSHQQRSAKIMILPALVVIRSSKIITCPPCRDVVAMHAHDAPTIAVLLRLLFSD